MKKTITIYLIIICILVSFVGCGIVKFYKNIPSDYQMVFEYCDYNFPSHTVLIFTEWNEEIMTNRANTNIVYVEKSITVSHGDYGLTSEGYYVRYNKKVPNGKKVISYFIYNPYSNYTDDIIAVIDNQIIR